MEFHEAANLFPMMKDQEFEELKADISAHGLREEITQFEGKILDGRNRYRACVDLGIAPRFRTYDGDDPIAYVVSLNKTRRHLTRSEMAIVAIEAEELYEKLKKEAESRRKESGEQFHKGSPKVPQQIGEPLVTDHSGEADQKLAEQFGTNREYIRKARNLKKKDPETYNRVKRGEKTISTVRREDKQKNKLKQEESQEKKKDAMPLGDIPENLRTAFNLIPQMDSILADLGRIKKWILCNGRDGALSAQMEWASILQNLGRSINLIEKCVPYRQCPKCNGKGGSRNCLPCKGAGWVSKKTINNLEGEK